MPQVLYPSQWAYDPDPNRALALGIKAFEELYHKRPSRALVDKADLASLRTVPGITFRVNPAGQPGNVLVTGILDIERT